MATQWSQQPYERSKSYQINNGTREKFKKPPLRRFFYCYMLLTKYYHFGTHKQMM